MSKHPTPEQVWQIKKYYGQVSTAALARKMRISQPLVWQWAKIAFSPQNSTRKWKHIMQNLDYLEFEESMETELLIEYQIKDVIKNRVSYRRAYTLHRMFFLVTIDHSFNFIAKFATPVPMNRVEYSPWPTGHDVTVTPLGHWEWMELKNDVHVVEIPTDGDYVGLFWCATKELSQHEA
jgi:hypothetical protein